MTYDQVLNLLTDRFPNLQIKNKNQSKPMKFIHWLLFLFSFGKNKNFLNYITTIGYTIFVPHDWNKMIEIDKILILLHEAVHMRQMEQNGKLKYIFKYLFWKFPVFWADGRLEFEIEAYVSEIHFAFHLFKLKLPSQRIQNELTGPGYFWPTLKKRKILNLIVKYFLKETHYKNMLNEFLKMNIK